MCQCQRLTLSLGLLAISLLAASSQEEQCLQSEDGASFLQTSVLSMQHARRDRMSRVADGPTENENDCHASADRDGLQMAMYGAKVYNQSLIDRYKSEGKITDSGFPTLNFVHITKVAGDAFTMASLPLGPYCMGYMNAALNSKVQITPQNCYFTQQPAMDLEHDIAESVYGQSEVFCAIRDPYAKVASSGCHLAQYGPPMMERQNGVVSKEEVDQRIRLGLETYAGGLRHMDTCFWIPQVDYLQGPFGCKHILDFDNIDSEYSNLVNEFGFGDLKLPEEDSTHTCHQVCDYGKDDMSPETLKLVESIYAKDIAFWLEFKKNRTAEDRVQG